MKDDLFNVCFFPWGCWFRIRGKGLHLQIGGQPLFSERNGHNKPILKIWKFRVRRLT